MSTNKQANKKTQTIKKSNMKSYIAVGIAAALILGFFIIKAVLGGESAQVSSGGDLIIPKSEVSEIAKFYPYKAGSTNMEVVAVKASDGTIRTAFNTCQVCFDSGRGYYKQEGDELVCQNCGNRFQIDQVEVIKGGCNPVPIMEENKTDDGTNIIISKELMDQAKELFANWKS